jgi:hypothetical protein
MKHLQRVKIEGEMMPAVLAALAMLPRLTALDLATQFFNTESKAVSRLVTASRPKGLSLALWHGDTARGAQAPDTTLIVASIATYTTLRRLDMHTAAVAGLAEALTAHSGLVSVSLGMSDANHLSVVQIVRQHPALRSVVLYGNQTFDDGVALVCREVAATCSGTLVKFGLGHADDAPHTISNVKMGIPVARVISEMLEKCGKLRHLALPYLSDDAALTLMPSILQSTTLRTLVCAPDTTLAEVATAASKHGTFEAVVPTRSSHLDDDEAGW